MAAIANFFEYKDDFRTVKPYLWRGEESELFPETNFTLKEKEVSLLGLTCCKYEIQLADNRSGSS